MNRALRLAPAAILALSFATVAQNDFEIQPPPGGVVKIGPNTMPTSTGTPGQVLTTDGTGNATWTSPVSNTSCSVAQEGSAAVITCEDGSTATIAGAGTIVVYPAGIIGDVPGDTIPAGEFMVADANGVVLAQRIGGQPGDPSFLVRLDPAGQFLTGTLLNDSASSTVRLTLQFNASSNSIHFLTDDCTGTPFVQPDGRIYDLGERGLYVGQENTLQEVLYSSYIFGGYATTPAYTPPGDCITEQRIRTLSPGSLFTPPDEILNAAFPVDIVQLP